MTHPCFNSTPHLRPSLSTALCRLESFSRKLSSSDAVVAVRATALVDQVPWNAAATTCDDPPTERWWRDHRVNARHYGDAHQGRVTGKAALVPSNLSTLFLDYCSEDLEVQIDAFLCCRVTSESIKTKYFKDLSFSMDTPFLYDIDELKVDIYSFICTP